MTEKHNPTKWHERIWQYYPIHYHPQDYHKLVKWWLDKIPPLGNRILEVGCFSSLAIIHLKHKYPEKTIMGMDINPLVCHFARTRIFYYQMDIIIYDGDGFNIKSTDKYFDVIFHDGLAEHFDEEDRIRLLKEHLRVAKYVLVVVPTKESYYPNTGYGDERWEDKEYWSKFMNDNFILKEEFNEEGHYGCILGGLKE